MSGAERNIPVSFVECEHREPIPVDLLKPFKSSEEIPVMIITCSKRVPPTHAPDSVLDDSDLLLTFWQTGTAWVGRDYLCLRAGSMELEIRDEIRIERCWFGEELVLSVGSKKGILRVFITVAGISILSHESS